MGDTTDPGTGPAAATTLTDRQRTILDVIRASVTSRGYPPSIREIGDAVGLTSPSSVAHQLNVLTRKGYIRRDPGLPRAMEVLQPTAVGPAPLDLDQQDEGAEKLPEPIFVPILGRIAAGGP